MRRRLARSCAGTILVLALTGCGTSTTVSEARPETSTELGPGVAFALYTHCGIDAVLYRGRWYARVGGPLDDGQGNPPPGWGNPYQSGTLTRSGARIVFQDEAGHREVFRPRPPRASPPPKCS